MGGTKLTAREGGPCCSSSELPEGHIKDQVLLLHPANEDFIWEQVGMNDQVFQERVTEKNIIEAWN